MRTILQTAGFPFIASVLLAPPERGNGGRNNTPAPPVAPATEPANALEEMTAAAAPAQTVSVTAVDDPPPAVTIVPDPMAQRAGESIIDYTARLQAHVNALKLAANQEKLITGHLGENLIGTFDGPILTLKIDLSKSLGKSASGKSTMIATTKGGVDLGSGRGKLNLNLFR